MVYESVFLGAALALLIAVLYSLRRIYLLEYKIILLDLKMERVLEHLAKSKKRK